MGIEGDQSWMDGVGERKREGEQGKSERTAKG